MVGGGWSLWGKEKCIWSKLLVLIVRYEPQNIHRWTNSAETLLCMPAWRSQVSQPPFHPGQEMDSKQRLLPSVALLLIRHHTHCEQLLAGEKWVLVSILWKWKKLKFQQIPTHRTALQKVRVRPKQMPPSATLWGETVFQLWGQRRNASLPLGGLHCAVFGNQCLLLEVVVRAWAPAVSYQTQEAPLFFPPARRQVGRPSEWRF